GVVNTSRLFGGALGLAILAAIATSHTESLLHAGHTGPNAALTGGFQLALGIAAAISLVGGLIAMFGLPSRIRPPAPVGATTNARAEAGAAAGSGPVREPVAGAESA
ncbi:MAG: MFS transporter, partial [Solirubrobacteraceae bacterium]